MKINKIDIIDMIEETKKKLESIPLETNKGTKAVKRKYHEKQATIRNEFAISEIKKYTEYKEILFEEITKRIEKQIPVSHTLELENQQRYLDKLFSLSVLESNYQNNIYFYDLEKSILELSDFDKENIDNVNDKIKNILDFFERVGIKIDLKLFNYSSVTLEYMTPFLDNRGGDDFYKIMRDVFEKLYFNNPTIINHLKLNLLYIVGIYKKKIMVFNTGDLNNNKNSLNTDNIYNKYSKLSFELDEKVKCDRYNILTNFLNDTLKIDDYFNYEASENNYFSNLLDYKFSDIDSDDQQELYNQVLKLKFSIDELKEYYYFQPVITDLLKLYKSNSDIEKKYNDKLKELDNQLKQKSKLFNNYSKTIKPSIFGNVNKQKIEQTKLLLDQKVEEISRLTDEVKSLDINYLLFKNITDSSSIRNLLLQATFSYPYLKKIFELNYKQDTENLKFDEFESRLLKFIYNKNNTFIDKTAITVSDIASVVASKYRLFNLKVNDADLELDSITKLESLTNSIVNLYYIEKSGTDMLQVKFIYKGKHL